MSHVVNLAALPILPFVKLDARHFGIFPKITDLHAPCATVVTRFNNDEGHAPSDFNFRRMVNKFNDLTICGQSISPLKNSLRFSFRGRAWGRSIACNSSSQNETKTTDILISEVAA